MYIKNNAAKKATTKDDYMFTKMRRDKQQLSYNDCIDILLNTTSGVLALNGKQGYPYALPLSFVFYDGCIYFHSALSGYKISCINENDKASFCVIAKDEILREKFTTRYKSIIAFGKVSIVSDESEKDKALYLIAEKYGPSDNRIIADEVAEFADKACVIKFSVEDIKGKASKES